MSNFNKGNRPGAGGGKKFGGGRFGKPEFVKKSWGDGRSSDRQVFEATCANCHKRCEVPFRPNGDKPVYCNECFGNKGGGMGGGRDGERFQKRDFVYSQPAHNESGKGMDDLKRQLEGVNAKLERLIQAVEKMAPAKPVAEIVELKDVIATAMKKKKKAAKK